MSVLAWIVLLVAALIALPLLTVLLIYNRLAVLQRRCEQALSDIDVQLRHRHDLVPSLVETVRSFASHERSIVDNVLQARAAALRALTPEDRQHAEAALTSGLTRLLATAESYPVIAAGSHYSDLRSQIVDVNNKIAAARRFFNLAISEYNGARDQFPANFIARRFGLQEKRGYSLGLDRMLVEDATDARI